MSFRSSTWSESASSELDPLFLSLKEPPGTTPSRQHPSDSRASNHALSSPSGSSDTYFPIPATVNFPLPPRRLRPGEILDITDPAAPNLISPTHQSQAPETHLTPVSLYGVAIGGNNPIQRTNSAMSGRAEVKSQNGGMTSLDLRKMSLRNRSSGSINNTTTTTPAAMAGAPPLPPETISLRARNPSKMLAPPHLSCLHVAPACPLPHPLPLPRHQHPYGHSHSHSVDNYSRYPSTRPINSSTFAARNLSLVETPSNPMPRLPPTRQAYQSLSYSPGNTEESNDHTIRQPLAESLSSDPNIIPPHFRRHPLLASSTLPQNHEASNVPLSMHSGIDQYNSRIKFAPLPAKSLASSTAKPLTSSTANRPLTSNTTSNSSSELPESQNSQMPKQGSMRKKSAWIHRWLLPASSKHAVPKLKQDISLPVSASLIVNNATGVPSSSTLLASAPALPRRNSVTDQVAPKPPVASRSRPRSRSFTAARPSLGMVADLAHGAPSRSIHETVAAGKSILNSSQCIVSPVRAHSLQHLIDYNTPTPAHSHHPREPIASQAVSQRKQSKVVFPIHHSQFGLSHNNHTLAESHPPRENKNNDTWPEMEVMAEEEPTKAKKKREIRFRNTLELIPDLVLPDEPSPQDQALVTDPTCASDVYTDLSESVSRPEVEGFKRGHKRRKTPIKNLGLFTHLRRPRSAGTDCTEDVGSAAAAHDQHTGRKLLQSSSLSHGSLHTVSSRISGKSRTTQQQQHLVDPPEESSVGTSSRKLAPKVNLTFVDLDHHIGSRFSVNTLLKEVHKSIPDVKPDEGSDESSSIAEEIAETHGSQTQINAPVRQYSDPVTRQELQTRSQGAEPRGTESEPRSDVPDVIFTSSDALGSPTTATSVSNPAEREPEAPQHNSFIEVVRADGADVVFQMVVPAPCAKSSQPVTGQQEREREESRQRHDTLHTTLEEDALTVISERLVALNKSIQAQIVPPPPPPPSIDDQALPERKGRSHTRPTPPGIATRRKTKRIEHWLSGVPSPEQSPAPYTHQFFPLVHHNNHLMPPAEHFHHSQEVLDHPDLLDCPESPIDGLHRDLPSRLEIRAPDPARTPA